MSDFQNKNASLGAGANVVLAGGQETTNQKVQAESNTDAAILASRSTAIEAQLAKLLVLLRQGPKNTMELRSHAIMQPAARVFQLKHHRNHNITTELLTLYDAEGVRHNRCARYHLVEAPAGEVSQ